MGWPPPCQPDQSRDRLIRAATVREWSSRTRVIGVSAQNRRFRYRERGSADSVMDPDCVGYVGVRATWAALFR